jgi:hypothetical protein
MSTNNFEKLTDFGSSSSNQLSYNHHVCGEMGSTHRAIVSEQFSVATTWLASPLFFNFNENSCKSTFFFEILILHYNHLHLQSVCTYQLLNKNLFKIYSFLSTNLLTCSITIKLKTRLRFL